MSDEPNNPEPVTATGTAVQGSVTGLPIIARENWVIGARMSQPYLPTPAIRPLGMWEEAQKLLKDYVKQNQEHVKYIFWVSVGSMIGGFLIVVGGVLLAYRTDRITPPIIAALSGIITQFIGVTFMAIYRSTMQQASAYFTTLTAMSGAGMALEVVNSISDDNPEKDKARAQLAESLSKISHNHNEASKPK